jgi:glycosyltransferase involved in cell wall biosynthesis
MKVAVVSSGNIPSMFANSINTIRHADAFQKLGHQVELYTVLRKNEKSFLKKINLQKHYNIKPLKMHFQKDHSLFFYNNIILFQKGIFFIEKIFGEKFLGRSNAEKKISKKLSIQGLDLCYSRSYFVAINNIKYGIPTVLETHASSPSTIPELVELSKLSNSEYLLGIVTIHEKIKHELSVLGFDEEKIIVLEDAVQECYFNEINKHKKINSFKTKTKKTITYIGSLKKGKGISKIISIGNELKHKEDITFQIVGGSKREIKKIKKKYLIGKNINFVGFIPGQDVPKFLASSDLLLLLYDLNEKNPVMDYITTSPIKLFEYMSSGVPILASKLPTIEKIVKNDDILIYENHDVSSQIIDILSDKKYLEYGKNAIELAKEFTYEKRVQNIISNISF